MRAEMSYLVLPGPDVVPWVFSDFDALTGARAERRQMVAQQQADLRRRN